jgi:hypothetical protein
MLALGRLPALDTLKHTKFKLLDHNNCSIQHLPRSSNPASPKPPSRLEPQPRSKTQLSRPSPSRCHRYATLLSPSLTPLRNTHTVSQLSRLDRALCGQWFANAATQRRKPLILQFAHALAPRAAISIRTCLAGLELMSTPCPTMKITNATSLRKRGALSLRGSRHDGTVKG